MTICNSSFYVAVAISLRARQPLEHLRHWLEQKIDIATISSHGSHLAQLVCGKAASILAEFDSLLSDSWWEVPVAQLECVGEQCKLRVLAFMLVVFYGSGFYWRIVQRVVEYPFRILLMLKSKQTAACPLRREVATEILKMDELHADVNIRKVRALFGTDLRYAARWGTCPMRLWTFILDVCFPNPQNL